MKELLHFDLKPYNTFGISAVAQRALVVTPDDDLRQLPAAGNCLAVGRGANLVPLADYDGTVLLLEGNRIEYDGTAVWADAGVDWDCLVADTLAHGLYGLENLSAIPGTVGASVVQNIGAYGSEAKDYVERVEAYDLQERHSVVLTAKECEFGYRDSLFKRSRGRYLVLRVSYRLSATFTPNLSYAALRALPLPVSAAALRDAIIALRWQKLPRPEEYGSAGSFFKNPVVSATQAAELSVSYPDLPSYPAAEAEHGGSIPRKLSAAWLIDRAGWKGRTMGRCGVWPLQPLVLYNLGGCTGQEVLALSRAIQDDIYNRFGVRLECEAIFI